MPSSSLRDEEIRAVPGARQVDSPPASHKLLPKISPLIWRVRESLLEKSTEPAARERSLFPFLSLFYIIKSKSSNALEKAPTGLESCDAIESSKPFVRSISSRVFTRVKRHKIALIASRFNDGDLFARVFMAKSCALRIFAGVTPV